MLRKVSNVTFTFAFSEIRGSLNNYQFIHDIKCKRCIVPYEIYYWKLLLKVHLLKIFIHHRLSLSTKWKIFPVPLWTVFAFEKIKNNILQNGFFSHENALYRKSGAITVKNPNSGHATNSGQNVKSQMWQSF